MKTMLGKVGKIGSCFYITIPSLQHDCTFEYKEAIQKKNSSDLNK